MRTFTVNGKEYKAKAFDFNMICDLEDMGISMEGAASKPMSLARAYFGLCTGKGREYAGKELEEHITSGGTLEDVMNVMSVEMESSDFFRALNKTAEEEAPKNQKKQGKKTE